MIRRYLIVLILYLFTQTAFAQQDPMFTQYMFNMLPFNPAYTGSRDVISLNAMYRNQWSGIEGAPQTMIFTADSPFLQEKIGAGIIISNDRLGVYSTTNFLGTFAYRLRLRKGTFAFGMQGGGTNIIRDFPSVEVSRGAAPVDLSFSQPFNDFLPTVGAGIYYSSDKFYAGLSVPNLLQQELSTKVISLKDLRAQRFRHFFLMAGYVFNLGSDFKLKPSTLIKFEASSPLQADLNLNFWMFDKFGIGLSYRSLDALSILLEIQATEQIRIGYSYDLPHSRLLQYVKLGGTHEVMLRYEFGYKKDKVLSPRFF